MPKETSLPLISANTVWYTSLKILFYILLGFNVLELVGLGYIFFCKISFGIKWKWIYLNSNVAKSDAIIRTAHEWLNFLVFVGTVILFFKLIRIIRKMGYKPLVRLWMFFPGLIVPLGYYVMQYLVMRDFVKKSAEKLRAQDAGTNRSLDLLQPWVVLILLFAIIVYTIQFKVFHGISGFVISAQIYLLTLKAMLGILVCVLQINVFRMLQNRNIQLSNRYISLAELKLQNDQLLDN